MVDGLRISSNDLDGKCKNCIMGHQACCPFDGETKKDLEPLDLVSFDLWEPSHTQSAGGKVYLMAIVDAGTSYKQGAYLEDKSDSMTIAAFEGFCVQAETATGRKIHQLCTDGAFDTLAWKEYCQQKGMIHEFTAPYLSSQNGLAECATRTMIEDVWMLLNDLGLRHPYWAKAATYSIYTQNLIHSQCTPGHIPLESFTKKRQGVSHLHVFGARCWAKIPTVNGLQVTGGSKLDPHSIECQFLRYVAGTGNYKVQDVATHQTFISRDLIFEKGHP